ncbi:MAG: hypothetical protein P8R54_03590 [Myxococcota bacterium]|nr:hypothetical protein [Myxococcota bacterium]
MSSFPRVLLVFFAFGCEPEPELPVSCEAMCLSAATLYGGCLTDWGVDWSAAGFDDEDAFLNSCQTWGWQMSLLQDAALEDGTHDDPGWLAATCEERDAALSAEGAACSVFTDIAWSDAPWAAVDTGE